MVDYSKWKEIEISDDEDETHPNIDTPSLFRWRHQARVERMEERQKEKEEFQKTKELNRKKIEETEGQLKALEKSGGDVSTLKAALAALKLEGEELKKKEADLEAKERLTPWNVDTISNPGFNKTVINKPKARPEESLTEEEREERMRIFIKENKKLLHEYGMLRKYEDSKRFLMDHPHLASEDTANYLVIWCINLEMEGKKELSHHVAHQCICMQYLLELSKQINVDPRGCIQSFFSKIVVADPEYKKSFEDELKAFRERVSKRAQEKLEAAIKEQEEEERQARLGPGGLDPVEVFESLPPELQECFEKQNIPLLQETIAKMDPEIATYHMNRCIDSGLWLPEGGKKEASSENAEGIK